MDCITFLFSFLKHKEEKSYFFTAGSINFLILSNPRLTKPGIFGFMVKSFSTTNRVML